MQYALRKLYHESPRVISVLYTAPTCGPCRTLKPILNKVSYQEFLLITEVSNIFRVHIVSKTCVCLVGLEQLSMRLVKLKFG